MDSTMQPVLPAPVSTSPQRIRWGAVIAGVVFGLALLVLVTTLWLALAFTSGVDEIRANIEWYIGGTAVGSLFLGALLAGWLSGVRGAGTGFFNGVTLWGLLLIVALAIGIPSVFDVFSLGRIGSIAEGAELIDEGVGSALWASFWTILGGFVAAGLGGLIGGAIARPANANLMPPPAPAIPERPPSVVVVEEADDDIETGERVRHTSPLG
ncbi:MAG TPA: hypothetical protein VIC58_04595 [Actinomycetota bacterium]|jgi:hypothetical protein